MPQGEAAVPKGGMALCARGGKQAPQIPLALASLSHLLSLHSVPFSYKVPVLCLGLPGRPAQAPCRSW